MRPSPMNLFYSPKRRKSRLARDFGGKRYGSQGYAMEELVAELGAAYGLTKHSGALVPPR